MKGQPIKIARVLLETPICFDERDRPTCCLWLPTGNHCKFLQAVRFGLENKCLFQEGKERLDRYEPDGRIQPMQDCPVHRKSLGSITLNIGANHDID